MRSKENLGTPRDMVMTQEEKEALRRLMETPGSEKEWDFFDGMKTETPPPEFFMRGEPKRRFQHLKRIGAICACVVLLLACSVFLAMEMVPEEVAAAHSPFQIIIANIKNKFLTSNRDMTDGEPAFLETIFEDEAMAMKKGRKLFPEMLLPSYIPEGFSFDRLRIKQDEEGNIGAVFQYQDENGNLIRIREVLMPLEDVGYFDNSIEGAEKEGDDVLLFKSDSVFDENILEVWKSEQFKLNISGVAVEQEELREIYHGLQ